MSLKSGYQLSYVTGGTEIGYADRRFLVVSLIIHKQLPVLVQTRPGAFSSIFFPAHHSLIILSLHAI
jgi:hypothetical protein